MHRTAWLAALALILAPGPSFGQPRFGPVGSTGRDGPPPAVAFRTVGAFGGESQDATERTVRLEMEGGQKLDGTMRFRPLIVDSDLGRYTIRPEKIRMIQFLKRANVDNAEPAEEPRRPQANVNIPGAMRPMRTETLVRGKVVTTSDKVIIGDVHIPFDFVLELEFGHLTPAPDKLRILTMIDDEAPAAPAPPTAKPGAPPEPPAPRAAPARPGAPASDAAAKPGRPRQPAEPGGSQRPGRGGH